MAAVPLGSLLGALSIARLVAPATRRRILRPLAVAAPLVLVPSMFAPHLAVVMVMAGLARSAVGAAGPIANGMFVQALPNAFRARAFGVVQGGLQVLQGGAVLMTGLLSADSGRVPLVVGIWSLVACPSARPGAGRLSAQAFTDAVAAAQAVNSAPGAAHQAGSAAPTDLPSRPAAAPAPRRAGASNPQAAPVGRHRL